MTSAKISLFENSVSFFKANNTSRTGPEFRYSGELAVTLSPDDLDDEYTTWVAVACRIGTATVTLTYTNAGAQVYQVEPGLPLLVQTLDDDTLSSDITIAPDATEADIEVLTYTGNTPLNPGSPAFLILNAGTGVTQNEFTDKITNWKDTRPVSLAPDNFDWFSGDGATFVASDSDFNGRPSVSFMDDSFFSYSGSPDSLWDFMKGTADFTVLSIMSVPDNALDETELSGIWNTSSGTANGFRALIEGGYRPYTTIRNGGGPGVDADELAPKPFVVIWRYDASEAELRMYWQGRWHTVFSLANASGSLDGSKLQIGLALDAADVGYTFDGKIADYRVYDRLLTEAEHDFYIALAQNNYGVDDTEVQGFPWIADCVNMHRVNRGVNWNDEEETDLGFWKDTRYDMTANAQNFDNVTTSPEYSAADATLGSEPVFEFDGVGDALSNSFTGTAGDHLGGSGMTITAVFYRSGDADENALVSMGGYLSASLDGTTIFHGNDNDSLTYEVDNGSDQDVVLDTGDDLTVNTPYAVSLRSDGDDYWIDEMNLTTGVRVTQKKAALGAVESTTTSAVLYLFSFSTSSGYLEGALAEFTTSAAKQTNDEITEFFTYAKARYGA